MKGLIKAILPLLAASVLFGCMVDEEGNITPTVSNEFENITFSGNGGELTHNRADTVNLIITGDASDITIASNLKELVILGNANDIVVNDLVVIERITINGNSTDLELPTNYQTSLTDNGNLTDTTYR